MQPLPFDPTDAGFSRMNALYLAHASAVAYARAPAAAAQERLGLRAVGFRHPVVRTRGFIGVCDTHAVLSFRGSDPATLATWVTDAVARLVERAHYRGRVHHGFSSALRLTWARVLDLLDEAHDKPLFLTGHSMGGALAVLASCRLAAAGRPAVATYTFGAPRVGDAAFCRAYGLPTYRVVNRLDLVPEMPMASLKRLLPKQPARLLSAAALARLERLAEKVRCYDHVNTLVYIDRDGAVEPDAEVEPWHVHAVQRALTTRGRSFHEGITDHLISSYIRGLEGRTESRRSGECRRIAPRERAEGRGKRE